MKRFDLELSVGIFVLAGIICLGYLSVKLAKMEILGGDRYEVYAIFSDIGGLQAGSSVAIAGVDVGRVSSISVEDYEARVVLSLPNDIELQEDTIASIKTRGLIGEKYLSLTPGGSENIIEPGGRIRDAIPPVDVLDLISKYAFGEL
jgi:phospholipid/cholesterol/gamma-HCH transport system substrate-binding protein